MGIGYQVGAYACSDQVSAEIGQMVDTRIDRDYLRKAKPLGYEVHRFSRCCRVSQHPGISHQTHKPCYDDPRDSDSFTSIDQVLPPIPGQGVEGRSVVVGIDEQVEVRDYYAAPGRPKASDSS